ncbi:MAG: 4-hydroxybenzoate octaprenyltransferase [Clostridia bacterium]|nr:MAG: 4-hydroxybenzoate octaprenyltransferase [Clostridia bacterium]
MQGALAAGWRKGATFLEMIKFEHTIFALPFAYLAALLAAGGFPTAGQFVWITLAMVGARTAAMSLNRIIDRAMDALNPRTAGRALPRGLLSVAEVWLYTLASFALLTVAAWQLNSLCLKLMPVAVAVLVIYSYTKRWTWVCHLVLGVADGLAPMGAWVGITAAFDLPGVLLWVAVSLWVAGFDVVYACQDIEFDRRYGVKSIPARFGLRAALTTARIWHLLAFIFLVGTGVTAGAGPLYWTGLAVAGLLLVWEHRLVSPADLSRVGQAFFNVNGYLSLLMLAAGLADALV